ncbi:MAG: M20 family metallopeptidase [Anaerolineales bacterium]
MTTENEFIQDSYEPYLQDLRTLVSVDCGTSNKAGVDLVGRWVSERCSAWGWNVERIPQGEYGDLWNASLPGQGQGRIMLLGHLDTVYPDGTAAARPMHIEGDRLLGPGVSDMKGGLLVGMYALRALQQAGFADFEELTFFFNSDEEVSSPVSKPAYLPEARKADAALVLESARSNGNIVSARKGSGTYRLDVAGRSAHAGVEPEKGVNAVVELAHRILALQNLNGLAPGVTVNATLIGGGTASNSIPESAWVDFDVRAVDRESARLIHEKLLEAARLPASLPGARVRLEGDFHFPPMERTAAVAFLVELAKETAAELGFQLGETATGGASDASNVSELGVPVLDGLGPVGGMDHSPEEYILPASILPRTAMLAGLIRRILVSRQRLADLRNQNN